jgi:hypothetical protein
MYYGSERYLAAAAGALAVATFLSLGAMLVRDVGATETATGTIGLSRSAECDAGVVFDARRISRIDACTFSHGSEIGLRGSVQ